MKAFLYAKGEELIIGHSVGRLCAEAARFDKKFAEKVKTGSILDGYYVTTRYPNSLPDSIPARVCTAQAAAYAVNIAGEIVRFAKHRISEPRS